MTNGRHRVAVWSTGGIGSIAIRAIHQRPNLDLVGVWVHSPEKHGRDAGDLANGDPIGVSATNDADALIALKPDCVVYAASGPSATRSRSPTT
jgi:2,4-diaminopentanoate dehydrogenase